MPNLISSSKTDLGVCLIDVYRAPSDLNDNWDIAPLKGGLISRLPNAGYGPDQPEPKLSPDDFEPMHLFEVNELWDDGSGHLQEKHWIEDSNGNVIASKAS